ncbi:MAG: hypothetical protein CMC74_00515 [Flavobacteriaceae bacterium]|nr:hypothetical protein [Flavobacteriaceae bacterium]|tara:strand:- start:5119 stop:7440 length:2322 start_codon:yes stop_codon:yes gene_type:complete
MPLKKILLTFFFLSTFAGFAQISIDETLTVQELVEDVLINSDCAEVSNFSSSTGTDFGDVNGIAFFDANGSDFPFSSGVILSSGNVQNAPGPNLTVHSDGGFGWPGDADLEANTTATSTNNASWIQFDFTPFVTEISFDFIMASEEYNENFECTFSDAFAFILTDQSTGISQNLAVLPGTTTPIEVTNIRPEVIGQCNAVNEEFFDQYNFEPVANPNVNTIPAAEAPIDFNGQTIQLTATATVVSGNDYTIKLVVADESDTAFDMAVFLEANSFNIGAVDLGGDILLGSGDALCTGEVITLDAGTLPDATYMWFRDGVEIPGETNPTLDVSETGLYRVEVSLASGGCTANDEVLVEFFSLPAFDLGEDILGCDNSPTILDATVTNPSELTDISYKWFQDGVEIVGETNPTLEVTEAGLYTAEVTGNGCVSTDAITVSILAFTIDLGGDQIVCDEASYTITAALDGINPSDASFLWSTGQTTQSITVTTSGDYTVTVTSQGCEKSETVTILFSESPVIDLGDDFETCFTEAVILDASPANYNPSEANYQWFLDGNEIEGATQATLTITQTGLYRVVVTAGNCISEDTILVSPREDLVVTLGDDFRTCPNETQILTAVTDETDVTYQWYLNGELITGASEATLEITIPENEIGSLTYTVEILLGECSGTAEVTILPYDIDNCTISEGLSPNGDGLNDCLDLQFLVDRSGVLSLEIFNRYGLSVFQNEDYINDFCGIDSDGNALGTGTYFYVLKFENPDPVYGELKTGWIYINTEE